MWMSHPNAHYVSAAFPHCKIVFLTWCSQKCDSESRVDRTLCSLMIHSAPGPEYNVNMCLDFFSLTVKSTISPAGNTLQLALQGLSTFFFNFFVCFQFFVSVRLFPVLFIAERNSQRKKERFLSLGAFVNLAWKSPFYLHVTHVGWQTAAGGNQEVLARDDKLEVTGEHRWYTTATWGRLA